MNKLTMVKKYNYKRDVLKRVREEYEGLPKCRGCSHNLMYHNNLDPANKSCRFRDGDKTACECEEYIEVINDR